MTWRMAWQPNREYPCRYLVSIKENNAKDCVDVAAYSVTSKAGGSGGGATICILSLNLNLKTYFV